MSFRRQVTDYLISELQKGTAPWVRPWHEGAPVVPQNMLSGHEYHGVNRVWLASQPFKDPRWLTYTQAAQNDIKISPKARGTQIEFWQLKGQTPKRVKTMTVYNAEQLINPPLIIKREVQWQPVALAEKVLSDSNAKIVESDVARYDSEADEIQMPAQGLFKSAEEYYGTVLHELAHWTGHPSRLNRFKSKNVTHKWTAREELRAELASFIMSLSTGIPHDPSSHAAYCAEWIKELENDVNEIFVAAADAEAIVNYLLGQVNHTI